MFLLGLLTLSYRQTIHAYPSGGGAYIVAKDNLGTLPGLVAAASLLVDYILTVAVSISAGVAAITSATHGTRFSFLEEHRVIFGIGLIAIIAWANLRGVRESGAIFAGPTYLFILSMLALVAFGFFRLYSTGETMPTPASEELHFDRSVGSTPHGLLTGGALLWLLLRAFAAGCTALTGVEAISNGRDDAGMGGLGERDLAESNPVALPFTHRTFDGVHRCGGRAAQGRNHYGDLAGVCASCLVATFTA